MAQKEKKSSAKPRKFTPVVGLIAFAAAVIVFLLTFFGSLNSLDLWVSDLMYQRPRSEQLPITIIALDEESISEMGSFAEWNRGVYARLVDKLCTDEYSPAVIAFDILYTSGKDPETDSEFARACQKAGNVITGTYFEFGEEMVIGLDDSRSVNHNDIKFISDPYPELKDVTKQAFTNNYLYLDGYARTMMPYFNVGGERIESLALATYRMYAEKNGLNVRNFTEDNASYLFTYTKKSGGIEHISIAEVLNGDTFGPEYFDGRIVMVGAYATGFQDDFPVPVDRGTKMYGVEIHANTVEAIHANKLQSVADKTLLAVIYALLAAALVIAVYFFELPMGAVATFGSVLIHLAVCFVCYKNGLYLKIVYYTLPAIIIYVAAIVYRYALARAAEAHIKHTFKQYLSPDVVDELVKTGADNIKLNGLKREVAVFFIDIRGFTTMSEGLDAETVVKILNQYFELVTSCIFEHQGMLDKFIGDAAMAVFNAPNDLEGYVHAAVNTAWDIRKGFDELNKSLSAEYGKTIDFGIGINCGEATVGNIGSSRRLDYTAIGDTVNTASRLEGKAKAGREIVVSKEVYDRFMAEPATALNDEIRFAYKGEIELKGKFNTVPSYSVLRVDEEQKKEPVIEENLKEYIAYVEAYEKLETLGGSAAAAIKAKLSELEDADPAIAEKYKVYRVNHIQK